MSPAFQDRMGLHTAGRSQICPGQRGLVTLGEGEGMMEATGGKKMSEKQNYMADEVAEMLGVSSRTIVRMAKNREIPSFQIRGWEWRFPKKLIDAMYERALKTGEFA